MKHLTKDFLGISQSRAIGSTFLTFGFLFGTWAANIPYIKEKFSFSDGTLGVILLGLPAGAFTMNFFGARILAKLGIHQTTFYGVIAMIIAFCIPLFTYLWWQLLLSLFLCGGLISISNIAMNTAVAYVENKFHINIISSCHGMFSVGLMAGALIASVSSGLDFQPGWHMMILAGIFLLLALGNKRTLFKIEESSFYGDESPTVNFILPTGAFLLMVLIGICGNITEGTMADWTSVYMQDVVHSNLYFIGWGLSGYSLFMALGRFFGDKLIPRFGANRILFAGALLCASGITLAITLPYTVTSIIGFSLVGAGVSCEAPILYSSAARVPNLAKGAGLAVLNTFAMSGFLAGPVLIGFISEISNLKVAFAFVVFLCLVWAYISRKVQLY